MGKCNISASQELTKLLRDLLKVQNANNKLTKSKKPTVLKNWLKEANDIKIDILKGQIALLTVEECRNHELELEING